MDNLYLLLSLTYVNCNLLPIYIQRMRCRTDRCQRSLPRGLMMMKDAAPQPRGYARRRLRACSLSIRGSACWWGIMVLLEAIIYSIATYRLRPQYEKGSTVKCIILSRLNRKRDVSRNRLITLLPLYCSLSTNAALSSVLLQRWRRGGLCSCVAVNAWNECLFRLIFAVDVLRTQK